MVGRAAADVTAPGRSPAPGAPAPARRLLVVSHPCVVAENQSTYLALEKLGWEPTIVVPSRWRHAYADGSIAPAVLPGLEGRVIPLPVVLAGRQQRHAYRTRAGELIRRLRPDAIFLEQEPFSVAALQWGRAAVQAGVPFGVQAAENLERPLPLAARLIRTWILKHARFVAARSPRAGELAADQGAGGEIGLVPHPVPAWEPEPRPANDRFTIGYAGRFVPEKGVRDLVAAVAQLEFPARLLLAGDGPLAGELAATPDVEIVRPGHAGMAAAYARMDVLVLPSRTTEAWAEQFGRVLVEALACGTPVVGSDSGEIPWTISATSGGRVFPEGDVDALAGCLRELQADEVARRRYAEQGRAAVQELFSIDAAAKSLDGLLTRSADAKPTVTLVAHGVHDGGGMERAFAELIRGASGRYRFVVVSAELGEDLRALVEWRKVRVPMRPIPLKTATFAAAAGHIVHRTHSDVVHTLGAIVPNRVDLASVHFCHAGHHAATGGYAPEGAPPARRLNTGLARRLALGFERWSYRPGRVSRLAAVSPGVAAELRKSYPGVDVVVTPNGVDVERFRPSAETRRSLRDELGVTDGAVAAVFVGGEWDRKGLAIAIESLTQAPVVLWVVGTGDEKRFRSLADGLDVADRISFFGPRADAERFYQAADVFVLPTLYETFSLAAHEAAACGLPVVATSVSGVNELVGPDGAAGRLVTRDAAAFGAALGELAADPELRGRLGREGRRRVSLLTWERSVEAVTSQYAALGAPAA
jgi:UDP-glucose:(heptosyl)LPS alpha-1,3-glucosyltransferase